MGSKTVTIYYDDLTGEECPEVQPVIVVFDGMAYKVDMGEETYAAYSTAIKPYIDAGERLGRMPKDMKAGNVIPINSASSRTETAKTDPAQNKAIRNWWRTNREAGGLPEVTINGRIPGAVQAAYQEYQGMRIPQYRGKRVDQPEGTVAQMSPETKAAIVESVATKRKEEQAAEPVLSPQQRAARTRAANRKRAAEETFKAEAMAEVRPARKAGTQTAATHGKAKPGRRKVS